MTLIHPTSTPLTFQQANTICQEYQHINGSIFEKDIIGKGFIECVAVAPFEESKQWQFAQYFNEYKDPVRSLQFYRGTEFDVIVLARPVLRKRAIHYKGLRQYLAENNIPFYAERYLADRLI